MGVVLVPAPGGAHPQGLSQCTVGPLVLPNTESRSAKAAYRSFPPGCGPGAPAVLAVVVVCAATVAAGAAAGCPP